MSDRDQKGSEIRDRASQRQNTSDRTERMGRRLKNDRKKCQATTRSDDPCSNDATNGQYCDKHQPNKFGELTWQYKRKQWYLDPELLEKIFENERGCGSLYDQVQEDVGSLSQKSFENTAAEFLNEHADEFIEFATSKYNTD